MDHKNIDIQVVAKVAQALRELNSHMIFVGGATLALYANDEVADEIRNTNEIELTVQLTGYAAWVKMQEHLAQLGFTLDPERKVICGFTYQGISVDIMPSEDGPIGKSNKWYKPGFEYVQKVKVDTIEITILSAPYFLATKFEAFHDRGGDYRTSRDFEDIIFVINNRTSIAEEVLKADILVKTFLKKELKTVISNPYSEENIRCHIHPYMINERLPVILEKIHRIIS